MATQMTFQQNFKLIGAAVRQHMGIAMGAGVVTSAVVALLNWGLLGEEALRLDLQSEGIQFSGPRLVIQGVSILLGAALLLVLHGRMRRAPTRWDRFLALVGTELLVWAMTMVGLMLLVLPGMVVATASILVAPLVIERPFEAAFSEGLRLGWRHFWSLLGTTLVGGLIVAGCGLVVVGLPALAVGAHSPITLLITVGAEGVVTGLVVLAQLAVAGPFMAPSKVAPEVVAAFD